MQSCSSCKTTIFLPLLHKDLLYGTDLSSATVFDSSLIELESLVSHSLHGSQRKRIFWGTWCSLPVLESTIPCHPNLNYVLIVEILPEIFLLKQDLFGN